MILEICVDSVISAVNAVKGGADRLELCSALSEGGLTPTPSFLRVVKENIKFKNVPVFCMIRPRGGPMQYSSAERQIILGDMSDLKRAGADGFVFGALTESGSVDTELCRNVINMAGGLPCTFHRAFDLSSNPVEQLQTIVSLGFKRILTSGCCSSAMEGSAFIKKLVEASNKTVTIMAGAGITAANCQQLVELTGVQEIHCSAKYKKIFQPLTSSKAKMGSTEDYAMFVTSADEVRLIKGATSCML